MPRKTHSTATLQRLAERNRRSVSTRKAANCLDVSRRTVRNMCMRGELKARKVGRDWKIDRNSLQDVLQHGTEDLS